MVQTRRRMFGFLALSDRSSRYWMLSSFGNNRYYLMLHSIFMARTTFSGGRSPKTPTENEYWITFVEVPGPVPDEPCVTDFGKHYLTLSWRKPLRCGGAPVMAYRVEKWLIGESGGAKWIEVNVLLTRRFLFTPQYSILKPAVICKYSYWETYT